MGVSGLISFIKKKLQHANKIDLLTASENNPSGNVELLVDFTNFLYSIISHLHRKIDNESPGWPLIGYLGGEYQRLDKILLLFVERLRQHGIEPVFFAEGARGSDPRIFNDKLSTWSKRFGHYVENNQLVERYLNNGSETAKVQEVDRREIAMLSALQAKATLRRSGARVLVSAGEADTDIARYMATNAKALAVLANDSDFCVMNNCKMIIDCPECFDWDILLADEAPETFPVRIWSTELTMQELELDSHQALMDVCILTGNDYTSEYMGSLKGVVGFHRTRRGNDWIQTVADAYKQRFKLPLLQDGIMQPILSRERGLKERIELSYRFYSLEPMYAPIGQPTNLSSYIEREVALARLSEYVHGYLNGLKWEILVFEEEKSSHSILTWTRPLDALIYGMCTHKDKVTVYARMPGQTLQPIEVQCPTLKWLPKADDVSKIWSLEFRRVLFDKLVCVAEVPVLSASSEYIFNRTKVIHNFVDETDTRTALVMYAVNRLLSLAILHKWVLRPWEIVVLLATSLHHLKHPDESSSNSLPDGLTGLPPTKPTSRSIMLANWFMYTVQQINCLASLLQIPDIPEPKHLFSGMYYASLYAQANKGGKDPLRLACSCCQEMLTNILRNIISTNRTFNEHLRSSWLAELKLQY